MIAVADPEEKIDLLLQKIENCNALYDFSCYNSDLEYKQIKREELIDIVEFLNQKNYVIPKSIYKDIINMVCIFHLVINFPINFPPILRLKKI